MKNLIVITLVILSVVIGEAQDYYVLQVKGKVVRAKTGVALKPRDVLKADETLSFSAANDAVAVVHAKNGRFILKPGKPNAKNEFMAYVKDVLSQASARLSTRSGGFNNALDFAAYFKETVYVAPQLIFPVSREAYPMNENAFFFVQYRYHNEEINKQLPANPENNLILTRAEIFTVDGKAIDPTETTEHKLFYFSQDQARLLSLMNLNLTDPKQVRMELETMQNVLTVSPEQTLTEMTAYMAEFYGKLDADNLKRWLEAK